MRTRFRRWSSAALIAFLPAVAGQAPAAASRAGTDFVAQARTAGVPAAQATALQAKIDDYLTELAGRGTQISPNQIDLHGAVLNVTVPGEHAPRQLAPAAKAGLRATECQRWSSFPQPSQAVPDGWFCAYRFEWGTGDTIGMFDCGEYFIPWHSTGSWMNNQTVGTVPRLYFVPGSGRFPWDMPAARSMQGYLVDWAPVYSIRNC
jgi:hypothetical protein